MTRLNQIIALEKTVRTNSERDVTAVNKALARTEPFAGLSRTYEPRFEDGVKYPSEAKKVQTVASDLLSVSRAAWERLWDLLATKDTANGKAVADVIVDGKPILTGVNVMTLLMLEKQMVEVLATLRVIPVLDPSENWVLDPNQTNVYRSDQTSTTKTKKVTKPVVLYEATKEHPAQVKEVGEDIAEGFWHSVKFSGAMSAADKDVLINRATKVYQAIKQAREEANTVSVMDVKVADPLLRFIFD